MAVTGTGRRAAGGTTRTSGPHPAPGAADAAPAANAKPINLALQGGGAHGAFTWGVLDRLLEDERLRIEGISGTSAGAMNAAVLAQGYLNGGAPGARKALDHFWHRMSDFSHMGVVHRSPWDRLTGNWNLDASPSYLYFDMLARLFSPYQLNPMNWHPIREVLEEVIDIPAIRACRDIRLFICATTVRTGKIRIFQSEEMTVDALLASACLPFLFQSIVIDGEAYWDGGYMGNPAIFPLIYHCQSPDVVVVEINPLTREGIPQSAAEIMNRVNEISFNSSLMREMRAIAFVEKLIDDGIQGLGPVMNLKKMFIHMISAEEQMKALGVSSKFNADLEFLEYLKGLGRDCADKWIAANIDAIGERSSIDIRGTFL